MRKISFAAALSVLFLAITVWFSLTPWLVVKWSNAEQVKNQVYQMTRVDRGQLCLITREGWLRVRFCASQWGAKDTPIPTTPEQADFFKQALPSWGRWTLDEEYAFMWTGV